jgi:hypothetical protein
MTLARERPPGPIPRSRSECLLQRICAPATDGQQLAALGRIEPAARNVRAVFVHLVSAGSSALRVATISFKPLR